MELVRLGISYEDRLLVQLALCIVLILSLLIVGMAIRSAPGHALVPASAPTAAETRLPGIPVAVPAPGLSMEEQQSAPRRLLLRLRGLQVADRPIGQLSSVSIAPHEYTEAELLLDTEVVNAPRGALTYRIISSLVGSSDGAVLWARSYSGAVHSRRALRLQLDRALHDALIHTLTGHRTRLMVEKIEPQAIAGPG